MTITLSEAEADAIIHALDARATALMRARDSGTLTQEEFKPIHTRARAFYNAICDRIDEARAKQACEAKIGEAP